MMTPRRPVIGVTRCSRLDDYVESVRRAGGDPVVLEWSEPVDEAFARTDGLLLTGGPDVDPALYGASPHPKTKKAEAQRDRFERELALKALSEDTPMLAICRGMQVLNVAAGGTLVQDIPDWKATEIAHDVKEPKDAAAHRIAVAPRTRLADLLRATEAVVNSRHHQAVDRPGERMVVAAVAPDGIIEAIERPGARFCVAVEWHPENFVESGEFLPLFRGLVDAARK